MWLCCGGDKINDAVVNECMSNKKKRAECFIIRRVSMFRLLNAISLKGIFVSE